MGSISRVNQIHPSGRGGGGGVFNFVSNRIIASSVIRTGRTRYIRQSDRRGDDDNV